jgi:hypothetical protein
MGRFARSRDNKPTSNRGPRQFAIASLERATRPEIKFNKPLTQPPLTQAPLAQAYDLDARPAGKAARSNKAMPKARPSKNRASLTGAKLFWIILASLIGVSSGWMLGRTWLQTQPLAAPEAAATNSAAVNPAERKQSPQPEATEADASLTPVPDAGAPAVEQAIPENQVGENQDDDNSQRVDRSRGKARRARGRYVVAVGSGRDVFKPFKALNPMKLKRLRIW